MILSPIPQPNYPVVMPIWITETNEKFVIDLIADLNTSEEGAVKVSTHPVSFADTSFWWC